ncbi:unnamed protein product [Leuciscus chuanchicus]
MAEGNSRGAATSTAVSGVIRPRAKPMIYETIDGKTIVEDEFLNFLAVKIKTLSQDELVLLASNNFESEWIESSKKLLFELCPNTKQLLNECGANIPRFVSHYLDELPPVTFNNMDVSNLLCKMERLHSEMCALRHAVKLQAEVGEDLRSVTSTIDRRVAKMERHLVPCVGKKHNQDMSSAVGDSSGGVGLLVGASSVDFSGGELSADVSTFGSPDLGFSATDVQASVVCTEVTGVGSAGTSAEASAAGGFKDNAASLSSPKWSLVVKQARKKRVESQTAPVKQCTDKPARRRPKPVIGTSVQSNIKVVRTKQVSVFATKFSPDLHAELLSAYLKENLSRDVHCERIETVNTRYSSFKVTVECEDVAMVYNPELWPEGSVVRRYYEPRKVRVKGSNVTISTPVAAGSVGVAAAPLS